MTKRSSFRDSFGAMRPQDAEFFKRKLTRRSAVKGGAALSVAGLFTGPAALGPTAFAGNTILQDGELPDDAAPLEEQVLRVATNPTNAKVLDFYEQVYERRICGHVQPVSGAADQELRNRSRRGDRVVGQRTGKTRPSSRG